jgi:hypothetical protein
MTCLNKLASLRRMRKSTVWTPAPCISRGFPWVSELFLGVRWCSILNSSRLLLSTSFATYYSKPPYHSTMQLKNIVKGPKYQLHIDNDPLNFN